MLFCIKKNRGCVTYATIPDDYRLSIDRNCLQCKRIPDEERDPPARVGRDAQPLGAGQPHGLYSKEFFYHNVQEILRANPDARYDIVCSDIENFGSMNDRYGQAWCDRFLRSIAGRLVRRRDAPDAAA